MGMWCDNFYHIPEQGVLEEGVEVVLRGGTRRRIRRMNNFSLSLYLSLSVCALFVCINACVCSSTTFLKFMLSHLVSKQCGCVGKRN